MRHPLPILLAASLLLLPAPGTSQGVLSRSVNLTDGWVGEPGTLHFNFDHRFRLVSDNVLNSPSFLLAASLPGRLLVGGWYASKSNLVRGHANEWEALARWSPPLWETRVGSGLTLGYNGAAGSVDGELALRVPIRLPESSPIDSIGLLGTARGFSDVADSGSGGWFGGGGLVLHLGDGVSLAGDWGQLTMDGPDVREVWGAALQLGIPTTPHTLSIKASNTNTATLQGASVGQRTSWGFEFTIPITLSRYFSGMGDGGGAASPVDASDADADVVEVLMNDDLDFVPETLTIRAGQTVRWVNVGEIPHTVTADPDIGAGAELISLPGGAAPFDSGLVSADEVFSHTFSRPGEYRYICEPHLDARMVGTIIVE